MDHPHHHPVLLLWLRRQQLGRKLGRKQQLWLRMQQRLQLRMRLWMQLRMRLQLRMQQQLRLLLQRQLLLILPRRRGARSAPRSPSFQRDRRSAAMAAISLWISSGVLGTSPAAQFIMTQPRASAISRTFSRHRRRYSPSRS